MALSRGTRLGPYEIVAALGAGGMGEVYRARDTKLNREVALKILPELFALDSNRVARFKREAQVLASLNHPNIGAIYGLEDADSGRALVLELVEGRTLAEWLAGRPLPVNEALPIARQITDALEGAHERGIVHRDLKPANIKITPQGVVKVLDFGLAKTSADSDRPPHFSQTPTMTSEGTREGVILGTVAYMSPEQARGKPTDKRTDIWAFGCVLFEMLTGRAAFGGETVSDTLVAILEREPDWTALPANTPTRVRDLLQRCLQKDLSRRLRDIGDARIEISQALVAADPLPTHSSSTRVQPFAISQLRLIVSTAALLIGVLVAVVWYWHHPPALTARDTLVLADFENTTGDALFDGTLKQALAVKLQESPFLNVLADDGIQQTLRRMGRPLDEHLTAAVGREICQRGALKAMVLGSIASLGSHYVVTLNALNCQTGESIGRAQEEAPNKEGVLRALGIATTNLRGKLGESLASIRRFDAPVEDVTTSSLEALKAYSIAFSLVSAGKARDAIPLLKRALELDPNFALAHFYLSVLYLGFGEPALVRQYAASAYAHLDRVTERERLAISAHYDYYVPGDLLKSLDTLTLFQQTYPRYFFVYIQLGIVDGQLGQFERAVGAFAEAIRLNPNYVSAYNQTANAYINLNRLDDAKAVLDRAPNRDSPAVHELLGLLAHLRRDQNGRQQEVLWLAEHAPSRAFQLQARIASVAGRLRQAREFWIQSAELDGRNRFAEVAALTQLSLAETEASFGVVDAARRDVTAAMSAASSRDVDRQAARVLAMSGFPKDARLLLDRLLTEYPSSHTLARDLYVPAVRGALDLAQGNPQGAIDTLQSASPYDAGDFGVTYLRATAYLAANRPVEAAAEFQKVIDRAHGRTAYEPLARLGVSRALARSGKSKESRAAYEEFFNAWKDADPELPILVAAREELAQLKQN